MLFILWQYEVVPVDNTIKPERNNVRAPQTLYYGEASVELLTKWLMWKAKRVNIQGEVFESSSYKNSGLNQPITGFN